MRKFYAIHDDRAIYGIGYSEVDAVNDAIAGGQLTDESAERCPTTEITGALYDLVNNNGGAVPWRKLHDGRLGTAEQFAAEG